MDIAGLLDDMKERVRTRGATPLVGGGLLGSFTRGLLGLDPSEEDGKFSQDMMLKAYQTGQALSNTPTPLALAVAPAALVKGAKSAKATGGLLDVPAQAKTVEQINYPGRQGFDPRYDPRVKERERLQSLKTTIEAKTKEQPQTVDLTQFEGRPFITSMSDRTAAGGLLTAINDVQLKRPTTLQGGQDFMFENPYVWASARQPVKQIVEQAQVVKELTGQNPLFIPWRMAPTGGDFATMTGETMLSFAESAFGKGQKKSLDKKIKAIIPDWPGIDASNSIEVYRATPDARRKLLKNMLDVEFREAGGLGIGEARLAVSDPKQLGGFDTQIMNIGEIFAGKPGVPESGHFSYPYAVPGQGIGRIDRDLGIFELLPNVVSARGIPAPESPRATDIRALQMKPYAGLITEELLKKLGY